ncbi:transmembrane protein 252-like [Halichoeres trimaculatus]|uniref:transmembrane protein 252-like n=1 Tax=Halichoeres trimaculatus TaxID=147232 RepID=UPI003D9EE439
MTVKKELCSLARMVLPILGFLLVCLGLYLMSLETESWLAWRLIPAYFTMGLGLLATTSGTFWVICHSMRSKLYHRSGAREQQMEVYSIERPISFPPSYEESQSSWLPPEPVSEVTVEVDRVSAVMGLAPPLYTPDSSVSPDCRWSWERPPGYSQVERDQQREEE